MCLHFRYRLSASYLSCFISCGCAYFVIDWVPLIYPGLSFVCVCLHLCYRRSACNLFRFIICVCAFFLCYRLEAPYLPCFSICRCAYFVIDWMPLIYSVLVFVCVPSSLYRLSACFLSCFIICVWTLFFLCLRCVRPFPDTCIMLNFFSKNKIITFLIDLMGVLFPWNTSQWQLVCTHAQYASKFKP